MSLLDREFSDSNIVITKAEDLMNWARLSSLWQLGFGLACCAIEMMATSASHYDLDRFGMIPRPSPRQSDVIIISGTVTLKMALRIKRLYEQMPDPKYIISMGSCANCGGPYWEHGYHVLKGVDRVIPVDVYVPGCPPRPEALLEGLLKLQEKIRTESLRKKNRMKKAEEIFEIIKKEFPDSTIEIDSETPFEPVISVQPKDVYNVGLFLRDDEDLLFDSLMCLSGVDDANGEKVKDEDDSEIIKGGTLSVYYHLHSTKLKHKITVKASAERENPEVESVEPIWKTADWHEREAYDMFGIKFLNHPNLIRILMPYDWDAGYPLRKDYRNPEFYKGMKVPY